MIVFCISRDTFSDGSWCLFMYLFSGSERFSTMDVPIVVFLQVFFSSSGHVSGDRRLFCTSQEVLRSGMSGLFIFTSLPGLSFPGIFIFSFIFGPSESPVCQQRDPVWKHQTWRAVLYPFNHLILIYTSHAMFHTFFTVHVFRIHLFRVIKFDFFLFFSIFPIFFPRMIYIIHFYSFYTQCIYLQFFFFYTILFPPHHYHM